MSLDNALLILGAMPMDPLSCFSAVCTAIMTILAVFDRIKRR